MSSGGRSSPTKKGVVVLRRDGPRTIPGGDGRTAGPGAPNPDDNNHRNPTVGGVCFLRCSQVHLTGPEDGTRHPRRLQDARDRQRLALVDSTYFSRRPGNSRAGSFTRGRGGESPGGRLGRRGRGGPAT